MSGAGTDGKREVSIDTLPVPSRFGCDRECREISRFFPFLPALEITVSSVGIYEQTHAQSEAFSHRKQNCRRRRFCSHLVISTTLPPFFLGARSADFPEHDSRTFQSFWTGTFARGWGV